MKGITKSFNGKTVIDNLNMTIESGSFTTLLGPSGCGKTTLLRMISGLETPDSGEIYFNDDCIFSSGKRINIPPNKRGLGFVFQDFALWPHMTVFENVAFGLKATGKKDNLKQNVMEALASVHLEAFASRYPGELSGGQKQRVAFARAIVIKPECILFDEPLSALDALLREEMRGELRELVSRLGITAIFVTHDQEEAMSMSSKIALIREGRIIQYDTPERIYHNPTSSFTAHFVGTSNWIDSSHLFRPESAHLDKELDDIELNAAVASSQFLGEHYQILVNHESGLWKIYAGEKKEKGEVLSIYINPKDIVEIQEVLK